MMPLNMTLRIAINGYGRIGRSLLRAAHHRDDTAGLEFVAINEPAPAQAIAHLTRYDSQHGRFPGTLAVAEDTLNVAGHSIKLLPGLPGGALPWQTLGVDLVMECSGQPGTRASAHEHLDAGATRVLFSQPAAADVDLTLIMGFNHSERRAEQRILSAGSCTTNALIPVLDAIETDFGLQRVASTTIHAAMNDQPVSDGFAGDDLHRSRSALNAVIPMPTALARGVSRLMPTLDGKVESLHLRVPTTTVSALDLTLETTHRTTVQAIIETLKNACAGRYHQVMDLCDDPVSSVDFAHDPHSAVIDTTQIRVIDNHWVKLVCWFDNEWGFANRMLDIAIAIANDPSA